MTKRRLVFKNPFLYSDNGTGGKMDRLKQISVSLVSNYDRKQTLRIASLVFLFLAMFGPWVYDKIYVPAEYPCRFPNVRLEGDF